MFFDDLIGDIYNISTDSVGETVMNVRTRFYRCGDLSATFTFLHDRTNRTFQD